MGWIFGRRKEGLITALERINLDRLKANAESEIKREELAIKKLEIEAKYSKELTESKIAEKDAAQERRIKARAAGALGGAKWKAKREAMEAPKCAVCDNSASAYLTAADIQYHHAGHPENFTPNFEWN